MSFTEIANKIEEQKKSLEEQKAKFLKDNQEVFKGMVKEFFEECPKVQAVVWDQYTPYFNDGEECVFGVNEVYFIMAGFNENELPSNMYTYEEWEYAEDEDEDAGTVFTLGWGDGSYEEVVADRDCSWAKERSDKLQAEAKLYPDYYDKIVAFRSIINSNEELMKGIFGDHASIHLTPTEIIVEECDHD